MLAQNLGKWPIFGLINGSIYVRKLGHIQSTIRTHWPLIYLLFTHKSEGLIRLLEIRRSDLMPFMGNAFVSLQLNNVYTCLLPS